jgi:hypothetical protein
MAASRRLLFQRIVVETILTLVAIAIAAWVWCADAFWFERHANAYRCIRDPHTLSLGNFSRWLAGVIALVLVLVVRPRVGRRVARNGISWAAVGRYALAIVLALGCAELILRRPAPFMTAPDGYSPTHIPDPRFAWKLAPSAQHTWHANGRDFLYAVNDEGNRAASIDAHSDHTRPTILIGGESIAMGMGNRYEDAFPALLEAQTGIQVVDLGVDAYGLDQIFMRESEVTSTYDHPLALVTIFHPEVAERSEVEDRPRLRVNDSDALELVPEPPVWVRDIRLRRIFRNLYHGTAEVDDLRAIVRDAAALARAHGAYPLFVTMNFLGPCLDVKGAPPFLFRTLFEDQNVPHIHVFLPANERLSDDLHPGPLAHKRIADAIANALHDAHVI